jgi:thiol-disulfide isomerase/thioredoxin
MKRALLGPVVIGLAWLTVGCSEQTATGDQQVSLQLPPTYDTAQAEAYSDLSDAGYQLLDEGKTEEAVATFTKQAELIPAGKWGNYNLACAYGRTGNVEEGITSLTKAVDGGWEDPGQLETDGDLESLRSDARFAPLVAKAKANLQAAEAGFANGLPRYDRAPMAFADTSALGAWMEEQNAILRANRGVWQGSQYVAARMDLEAKRLAALKELKKDDPAFDLGLERIEAISKLKSIWGPWGTLAKGVIKEADTYLATKPGIEGQNQAHYRAGIAAFCETRPEDASSPEWPAIERNARAHFTQVAPGTKYAGAAQAWLINFDLMNAGANRESVLPKVKSFTETYKNDQPAMNTAAAFFQGDVVASLWPIPIEAVDIDNKPVSLDQYKGRVVLVDFWATWCGPCRAELPNILAAYDKYKDQGFDILSISLDYADKTTPEAYRAWIAEKGMDKWRHVYDQKAWEGPLVEAYLVRGIPNPVLIGRDGSLAAMGDNLRGENLAKAIEAALEKKGV